MTVADSPRANYNCPSCGSSDVFQTDGSIYECRPCGNRIHEGVLDAADSLRSLAERDDNAGTIAAHLLETGGVTDQ